MRVMVECYHDTAIVRTLGIPVRQLGHEHGKGNVLRALSKWDGDAIGMVDADPGKLNSNPAEMANYREIQSQCGLTLMKHHADARKALVVLYPVLEEWLLSRSSCCGLRLGDYALPDSARTLHKSPRYDLKPGFLRFLADLAARDDGMKTLRQWLTDR